MNKKKLLLLTVILVLVLSLGLVACSNDGNKTVTYGEWEIVNLPTDTAEGVIKRTGSDGKEYTFTLPILTSENYTKSGEVLPTCEVDGKVTYTIKAVDKDYSFDITLPKLGHSFNDPTYAWTDVTLCTATRVCSRDASHTETTNATITSVVTAPTFDADGYTTYTATFYKDWAEAQVKVVVGDGKYTLNKVNGKAATCLETGLKEYWAGSNGVNYEDEAHTKVIADLDAWRIIPALGHSWGESTYTWIDTTSCEATRVCSRDNTHIESVTATNITSEMTLEPTFTAKGQTTYTATFKEEWAKGSKPITKVVDNIPMYTKTAVTRVEPTVNTEGNIAYWAGSNGKYYSDEACSEEITLASTVIPKVAVTTVDKVEPTYGAAGVEAYYKDASGNKYQLGTDGLYFAVTSEDLVIDELLGTVTIYVNGALQDKTISHKKSEDIKSTDIYSIVDAVSGKDYAGIKVYDSNLDTRKEITDLVKHAKDTQDVSIYIYKSYTITFNANGGTSDITSVDIEYGDTYGAMPTPTRTGFTFDAWYTENGAGTLIDGEDIINPSNHTIYANWVQNDLAFTLINNDTEYSVKSTDKFSATEVTIPNVYKGKSVAELGNFAFDARKITKINNLNHIKKFGNNAFANLGTVDAPLQEIIIDGEVALEYDFLNASTVDRIVINKFTGAGKTFLSSTINYFETNTLELTSENMFSLSNINTAKIYPSFANAFLSCASVDTIILKGDDIKAGKVGTYNGNKRVIISSSILAAEKGAVNTSASIYLEHSENPKDYQDGWYAGTGKVYFYRDSEPTADMYAKGANYWHWGENNTIVEWKADYTLGLEFKETNGGYEVSNYTGTESQVIIPKTYLGQRVVGVSTTAFSSASSVTEIFFLGTIPDNLTIEGKTLYEYSENEPSDEQLVGEKKYWHYVNGTIEKYVLGYTEGLTFEATTGGYMVSGYTGSETSLVIPDKYKNEPIVGVADTLASKVDKFYFKGAIPEALLTNEKFNGKTLSEYRASEPTCEDWAVLRKGYWYYGEGDAIVDRVCTYTRGLMFTLDETTGGYFVSIYKGTDVNVEIPDTYKGGPVYKIGKGAFSGYRNDVSIENLESVTLGKNVTSIGDSAFLMCEQLSTINGWEQLTSIEQNAFRSCALTSASPKQLTFLDTGVFSNCGSLTEVNMPNLITIDDLAFAGSGIINIPNSVKSIRQQAFIGCWNLSDNIVLNNLEVIKPQAFQNSNIKKFSAPNLTSVDNYVFLNCANLISCDIPKLEVIGAGLFNNSGLLSFDASNVTSIGQDVFNNCKNLSAVIIGKGVTIGANAFSGCTALTIYTTEETQPDIGWDANFNPENRPVLYGYESTSDHTYTFDTKGGDTITSITAKGIVELPIPTKKDMYFDGWYENPELSGYSYFTKYYNKSGATLYAKWLTESEYNDGRSFERAKAINVGVTETANIVNPAQKVYYKFIAGETRTYSIARSNYVNYDMTDISIYDSKLNRLGGNTGYDNTAPPFGFAFTQGETYYIMVSLGSEQRTGSFDLTIS